MRKVFLILFALSLLPGCGPFWVDPYVTVNDSALNWVEIHYYNMNKRPIRRISVSLFGSGHVEVKKGTSEQVSDDFAKGYVKNNWNDIRTHRMEIGPKHAKDILQNLVNHGLLDREKTFRGSDKSNFKRFMAVRANVNTHTYTDHENIFEVDPELAEELLDVVRMFDTLR